MEDSSRSTGTSSSFSSTSSRSSSSSTGSSSSSSSGGSSSSSGGGDGAKRSGASARSSGSSSGTSSSGSSSGSSSTSPGSSGSRRTSKSTVEELLSSYNGTQMRSRSQPSRSVANREAGTGRVSLSPSLALVLQQQSSRTTSQSTTTATSAAQPRVHYGTASRSAQDVKAAESPLYRTVSSLAGRVSTAALRQLLKAAHLKDDPQQQQHQQQEVNSGSGVKPPEQGPPAPEPKREQHPPPEPSLEDADDAPGYGFLIEGALAARVKAMLDAPIPLRLPPVAEAAAAPAGLGEQGTPAQRPPDPSSPVAAMDRAAALGPPLHHLHSSHHGTHHGHHHGHRGHHHGHHGHHHGHHRGHHHGHHGHHGHHKPFMHLAAPPWFRNVGAVTAEQMAGLDLHPFLDMHVLEGAEALSAALASGHKVGGGGRGGHHGSSSSPAAAAAAAAAPTTNQGPPDPRGALPPPAASPASEDPRALGGLDRADLAPFSVAAMKALASSSALGGGEGEEKEGGGVAGPVEWWDAILRKAELKAASDAARAAAFTEILTRKASGGGAAASNSAHAQHPAAAVPLPPPSQPSFSLQDYAVSALPPPTAATTAAAAATAAAATPPILGLSVARAHAEGMARALGKPFDAGIWASQRFGAHWSSASARAPNLKRPPLPLHPPPSTARRDAAAMKRRGYTPHLRSAFLTFPRRKVSVDAEKGADGVSSSSSSSSSARVRESACSAPPYPLKPADAKVPVAAVASAAAVAAATPPCAPSPPPQKPAPPRSLAAAAAASSLPNPAAVSSTGSSPPAPLPPPFPVAAPRPPHWQPLLRSASAACGLFHTSAGTGSVAVAGPGQKERATFNGAPVLGGAGESGGDALSESLRSFMKGAGLGLGLAAAPAPIAAPKVAHTSLQQQQQQQQRQCLVGHSGGVAQALSPSYTFPFPAAAAVVAHHHHYTLPPPRQPLVAPAPAAAPQAAAAWGFSVLELLGPSRPKMRLSGAQSRREDLEEAACLAQAILGAPEKNKPLLK